MKKKSLVFSAAVAVSLFHAMPLSAQEAPKPVIVTPANVPAPVIIPDIIVPTAANVPLPVLQKAVKEGAIKREWMPKALSENVIRCDLNIRGKHRVVVDAILASDKITFRYVSSENMNYDPVKRKIHRKYEPWVKILGQEINKILVQNEVKE